MKSSLSLMTFCSLPVATVGLVLPSYSSISCPGQTTTTAARLCCRRGCRLLATIGDNSWGDGSINNNADFRVQDQNQFINNNDNSNNQNDAWIQDGMNSFGMNGGESPTNNNQNNLFDSAKEQLFGNNNNNNNLGQEQNSLFGGGGQNTMNGNANEWGVGAQQQPNNNWGQQQAGSPLSNLFGSLKDRFAGNNNLNNPMINAGGSGGPNDILARIMNTPTPGTADTNNGGIPVVVPVLLAPAALLVLPVEINVVLGVLLAIAIVLQACAEETGDGLPNQVLDFFRQPTPGISELMYVPITYPMVLVLGGIFLPQPTNFAYLGIFAALSTLCSTLFENERDIPSNLTALVATVLSTGLVGSFVLNPKEMAALGAKTTGVAPVVLALPLILAGVTAILAGLDNNLPNFGGDGSRDESTSFGGRPQQRPPPPPPRNQQSNPWGASMNYNQASSMRDDGGSTWGGGSPPNQQQQQQQQQQQGYNMPQQQQLGYNDALQPQPQQPYNAQQQQHGYNPGYNEQQQVWGDDNDINSAMFERPPQENFVNARSSLGNSNNNNNGFQRSSGVMDDRMMMGQQPYDDGDRNMRRNNNYKNGQRSPQFGQSQEQVLTANEGFLGRRS